MANSVPDTSRDDPTSASTVLVTPKDAPGVDLSGVRGTWSSGRERIRVEDTGICLVVPDVLSSCRPTHWLTPSVGVTSVVTSDGRGEQLVGFWASSSFARGEMWTLDGRSICATSLVPVEGLGSVAHGACRLSASEPVDLAELTVVLVDGTSTRWTLDLSP